MKKNIIIAGVARAGKSSLCAQIAKRFGYQHMAMDALIEGFEDLFPQMDIDTHVHSIDHISKRIAPFINAMFTSGEYDKLDYGLVIDVCQLLPSDYLAHISPDLCDIYYLTSPCESAEARLSYLDRFDTEKEYTFHKSPEKRLEICRDLVEDSQLFEAECAKYGLPCFDTLRDRQGAFEAILGAIEATRLRPEPDYLANFLQRSEVVEGLTEALKLALEPLAYVHAFWFEGSDANGTADAYSDIDYYIDFDDAYEEEAIAAVEAALAQYAPLEYRHIMHHGHPKLRQRVYHLKGTSDDLMIDFCFQLHSRNRQEYVYLEGDPVETARIIFDKDQIIRFKAYDGAAYIEDHERLKAECDYRYSQHRRVLKYVARRQLPEALAYYQRYVVEPLVVLLRMAYTPAHTDYHLLHISTHLPKHHVKMLEAYLGAKSLEDIERMTVGSAMDKVMVEIELAYLENPDLMPTAFWKFKKWRQEAGFEVVHHQGAYSFVLNQKDLILKYPFNASYDCENDGDYRMMALLDRQATSAISDQYTCTQYFKLHKRVDGQGRTGSQHDQVGHGAAKVPVGFKVQNVCPSDTEFEAVKDFINANYTHIRVTKDQVGSWTRHLVYDKNLWIWILDEATGTRAALGIADYDSTLGEGALEWIQVDARYRGRGLGQVLVETLHNRMPLGARFTTVSGEVNNATRPEALYRKCGFEGKAIWHVYKKRT